MHMQINCKEVLITPSVLQYMHMQIKCKEVLITLSQSINHEQVEQNKVKLK